MSEAAKNRRSFSMAYLLAQCAPPLKLPDKQPTAYFYGHVAKDGETPTHTFDGVDYVGAVLPKVPEWDETVYPYAVISTYSGIYALSISESPFDVYVASNGKCYLPAREYSLGYTINVNDESEWKWNNGFVNGVATIFTWTNTNLYTDDRKLCMEKSDYIPVYE